MLIGEISLYPIEVINDGVTIYKDISDNIPDHLKNCEIKNIKFNNGYLKIEILE
ncbi:MAG: hypothetical protein HFJ53_08330 [Clostridia bacterium]|nr:hypothetical protein [Clostridia bacterium]